ncbi:hypothetical protein DERP_009483 [Dermatophagoides pteronyssinus]|uniref:Uncharacterized protein n=1 Tax=Dermatophagoides pteronyssinus TaxID=6956 RepID=A0ABQ8IU95_DERPT|nr:hypothetical protein DERP_009483 [Dermatophagoides pteronyssinus]
MLQHVNDFVSIYVPKHVVHDDHQHDLHKTGLNDNENVQTKNMYKNIILLLPILMITISCTVPLSVMEDGGCCNVDGGGGGDEGEQDTIEFPGDNDDDDCRIVIIPFLAQAVRKIKLVAFICQSRPFSITVSNYLWHKTEVLNADAIRFKLADKYGVKY